MMVGAAAIIWDDEKNVRVEAVAEDGGTLRVGSKDGR